MLQEKDGMYSKCGEECMMSDMQQSVLEGASTGWVDLKRFCHYECKPSAPHAGAGCEIPTEAELLKVKTRDGNGRDPNYIPEGTVLVGTQATST